MQVHDQAFYKDQEIELRLGTTATALDDVAGSVELSGGDSLRFDALLLTTGSSPRRLALPGAELDGIHYLRTIADSDAIRARLERGGQPGGHRRAAGSARRSPASARQRGLEVTVVTDEALPNERFFGQAVGQFYRDLHAGHGVELVLGDGAAAFEGDGSVSRVRTDSGRVVECDFVVIGAGATPNVELGQRAGLGTDDGILVDPRLQSSAPNVFAAGTLRTIGIRSTSGESASSTGPTRSSRDPVAARSMLGDSAPYDELPYFFSDQYDAGMEYSGLNDPSDEVVFRGDAAGGEFVAFWLRDGVVDDWDERQRLGRQRARAGADPLAQAG